MPDTALTAHDDQTVTRLVAQCFDGEDCRKPALPGFLARSIGRINWLEGVPDPWTLRWVLEACKAELTWATSDWNRLNPKWNGWQHEADGIAAAHRLPHERMAARVLNAWSHASLNSYWLREQILVLKSQRDAANDLTQDEDYRAAWANNAAGTVKTIRDYWLRRHEAWRVLVAAMRAYRALREEIGPMTESEAA